MGSLTADKIRTLSAAGRYGDGDGLYLNIAKGGSKSWVQRVRLDGQGRTDKGLGSFPSVTLSAARRLAKANVVAISSGRNPWAAGVRPVADASNVPTFGDAARKVYTRKVMHSRNAKYVTWIQSLERHAKAIMGIPINEISKADVLACLNPIWTTTPEQARRVRSRMRTVFEFGMACDYITFNPAGETINAALEPMPKCQQHMKALPYGEVAGAIAKVNESESWAVTKLCFHFIALTACRSGEARGMLWSEVDLDGATWTIPAGRMKANREHRQPLSQQAINVLRKAHQLSGVEWPAKVTGLVFKSPSGVALSENALSLRAKKSKLGCHVHGLRSSFRDWASELTDYGFDTIEKSLAHDVGGAVERAYYRSDLLERRRPLLQAWADFLEPSVSPF